MRRRIRKKLRLGEFAELGFTVRFSLDLQSGGIEPIDVTCAMIEDVIEPRNLRAGGGGAAEQEFFVSAAGRKSASRDDQEALAKWLSANAHIKAWKISSFQDAHHGSDNEYLDPVWCISGPE